MGARGQEQRAEHDKSKKRKRIPGNKGQVDTSVLKKSKKAIEVNKGKQQLPKNEFRKSENQKEHDDLLSKRSRRQRAKELADARKKKRKRHYTLEQDLAILWEKMRRHNIAKEERSKLITEALEKMKGKIPEIASSHVSSRVLQTCIKFCSETERNAVFEELRPHFLTLASNTYAVHLVKKMLDNASKSQLAGFISTLHGHVATLLRHMVGSVVVEHAYQLGNATQKRTLLMELYSTELQLFKDLTAMNESRLVDIISKLGLQKSSVLRHMTLALQPILEKGIVDHSIIHKALVEYFSIADKFSAAEVIQQLSGSLLVRMIHTREGSKVGMLCVKHGSAKERKKIVKGMKGHVGKIAHDHCGSMVLVCILSTVDDTKLLTKVIIRELQAILKELILDKSGRRPILQLLHPSSHRCFSPDDLASLNLFAPSLHSEDGAELQLTENKLAKSAADDEAAEHDIYTAAEETDGNAKSGVGIHLVEGGKKDPLMRRQELLVESGLAEILIDTCIENAEEYLRSNFGKEVLYEVAIGGADGILRPSLNDMLVDLHQTIASLAAQSKTDNTEHLLENFHSSRTIRKLALDCPEFACTLWKVALEGKSNSWARGHSSKVVSAFVESSDSKVRDLAKEELQPLIDGGILKIPESKQAARES
ncbi:Pumilio 24 [Ancistrocladus abbreviatus]